MGNRINCVIVNKRSTGPAVFAVIERALRRARIPSAHDDSRGDAFLFFINADYFPRARAIFEKLKRNGKLDGYVVEEGK